MLNQPAFLIVPSGFSTISVSLRGTLEMSSWADTPTDDNKPGRTRNRPSSKLRRLRIASSWLVFVGMAPRTALAEGELIIGVGLARGQTNAQQMRNRVGRVDDAGFRHHPQRNSNI